uniref:Cholesteryl ester transfer protein n=1 Tax=Leptobrachium leishanense TaxID=445787 RepID=A0A8C5Q2S4_9ANUR
MWLLIAIVACLVRVSSSCEFDPSSPLETGIVCRLTKPAALVLNEQTTQVIRAAFRHASIPDINGEKSVRFLGKVTYGLANIQISNLTIDSSEVDLIEDDVINIVIRNVSVSLKGTLNYGYGAWFVNVEQSIDFEIYSSTDLVINNKLTCMNNRAAADTSDCYLTFHKFVLHLHGNKEPGWINQLFTDFISFTVKLVLKSQICKEINYVANLLASFIQDRAEDFLRDRDIGVHIDITAFPVTKANYLETHHKGSLAYKNISVPYNSSMYSPSLLTQNRMLYFWFSDHVLNSLGLASFLDNRLVLLLTGHELQEILKDENESHQEILQQIFQDSSNSSTAKVWSLAPPTISVTPRGTCVTSAIAVQLPKIYFETDVIVTVQAFYENKTLRLHVQESRVQIKNVVSSLQISQEEDQKDDTIQEFLTKAVTHYGIPEVIRRLELALTSLMDSKGLYLFELTNPEVVPHEGYLIVQMDFAFPHHLLIDFLKKSM